MAPERDSRVFDTLFDEYKLQRSAESEMVQRSQHTITFGGATIGILIAAGFNIWNQVLPATLIFLVVVPLISTAIVVQWVGQMREYQRTHQYVNALEGAVKAALRGKDVPDVLFGKHKDRSEGRYKPDESWFQSAGMFVFGLLAAGSIVVGVYKGSAEWRALVVTLGVFEFIVGLIVAFFLFRALDLEDDAWRGTAGRRGPSPERQAASPRTVA